MAFMFLFLQDLLQSMLLSCVLNLLWLIIKIISSCATQIQVKWYRPEVLLLLSQWILCMDVCGIVSYRSTTSDHTTAYQKKSRSGLYTYKVGMHTAFEYACICMHIIYIHVHFYFICRSIFKLYILCAHVMCIYIKAQRIRQNSEVPRLWGRPPRAKMMSGMNRMMKRL